jgi:hypothetical protein
MIGRAPTGTFGLPRWAERQWRHRQVAQSVLRIGYATTPAPPTP